MLHWQDKVCGRLFVLSVLALVLMAESSAQLATSYVDSRGQRVAFPLGALSFADEVLAFNAGLPATVRANFAVPALALGPPDYVNEGQDLKKPSSVAMGCGGVLTLKFLDNVLVDVPGPDLYVFEVGPDVEPTDVAVSVDGKSWRAVGATHGGTSMIDISPFVIAGERFRYVRITDKKTHCSGDWPGADIDAVGAIGSAFSLVLEERVLFDFGKSALKPGSHAVLERAARRLGDFRRSAITIEGHTDSVGSADFNRKLSIDRAMAVRTYLQLQPSLKGRAQTIQGFGAARPRASNDTPEGRQSNRRVEILALPAP